MFHLKLKKRIMKVNFKKVSVVVFILAGSFFAKAQNSKIAHIDFEKLVSLMPETKKMEKDLQKLSKTYADEIKTAQNKLKAKYKKYEAEQISQTAAQNKKRAEELQQEQMRLQQLSQTAQQEMQQKQSIALKPILEKAKKAINEVAKKQGILYVLDVKSLIVAEGVNLFPAVKKKLGLK